MMTQLVSMRVQVNYFHWDKTRQDPQGFYRFSRLLVNFRRCTAGQPVALFQGNFRELALQAGDNFVYAVL